MARKSACSCGDVPDLSTAPTMKSVICPKSCRVTMPLTTSTLQIAITPAMATWPIASSRSRSALSSIVFVLRVLVHLHTIAGRGRASSLAPKGRALSQFPLGRYSSGERRRQGPLYLSSTSHFTPFVRWQAGRNARHLAIKACGFGFSPKRLPCVRKKAGAGRLHRSAPTFATAGAA